MALGPVLPLLVCSIRLLALGNWEGHSAGHWLLLACVKVMVLTAAYVPRCRSQGW